MNRVRIGLTGLAFVFLLVLISAAGLRPGRSVAPAGAQGETLAVLGVAPGMDSAAPAKTAPPAQPVKQPAAEPAAEPAAPAPQR